MVLILQYAIGFGLLVFALYNSALAFTSGIAGIANLIIAIFAGMASFILLKDLYFAIILHRLEGFFFPKGSDNGSDFSSVETFIYRQDFEGALRLLDEYLEKRPDSSMGHYKKCTLLYDHLKRPVDAVEAGCHGLSSMELVEADEKLIFLILDILLEMDKKDQVKLLVQQLLERIKNPTLKSRLKLRCQNLA